MGGMGAMIQFAAIMLGALILGALLAFIGLSRGEKYRGLGWFGLLLNLGPIVICFTMYLFHS